MTKRSTKKMPCGRYGRRHARLLGKAIKVFGDLETAKRWLNSPQFGLGGAVPLDYAFSEIGAREVEKLLGRIEYGVYS